MGRRDTKRAAANRRNFVVPSAAWGRNHNGGQARRLNDLLNTPLHKMHAPCAEIPAKAPIP